MKSTKKYCQHNVTDVQLLIVVVRTWLHFYSDYTEEVKNQKQNFCHFIDWKKLPLSGSIPSTHDCENVDRNKSEQWWNLIIVELIIVIFIWSMMIAYWLNQKQFEQPHHNAEQFLMTSHTSSDWSGSDLEHSSQLSTGQLPTSYELLTYEEVCSVESCVTSLSG